MRSVPAGQTGGTQIAAVDVRMHRLVRWVWYGWLVLASMNACSWGPTLREQEQLVRANNLVLDKITTRAVVNVWGKPPYHHSEFTQFFVMPDQTMIPRTRVPLGEGPTGWDAGVYAGEGVFFVYPDRGWLLVFHDEYLVYREQLKPDEVETLVKGWAYEDRFRTRLDGTPVP